MTVHKVAEAWPVGGSTNPTTIQQRLAAGFPLVIETGDDAEDLNFDSNGSTAAAMVPEAIIVRDTKILYGRDPANSDPHNGATVLVTACGKHYTTGLAAHNFTNVLDRTNTPPSTPAAGDRVIVGPAPSGAFASNADDLGYYNGAQWVFVSPVIGQSVYVRDEDAFYYWSEAGVWTADTISDVGASELAFPWGAVAQEETAIPPGTRATPATPTMPLGGTAANINDNSTATEATTSALGDLSAASADGRVIAKLDLGADTELAAIQAVGLKASAGASSSANAMKLAYATAAAPTTWVDLGTGFTLNTGDQTVARSGTFTARYVAVITEAKDWTTATHTLDDLNAYKRETSLVDGTFVIVAANGIGVFSGHDSDIAEAVDGVFVFHDPYDRAEIFDDGAGIKKRFDDVTGTWVSAAGAWIYHDYVEEDSANTTDVAGSAYTFSAATPPTTSHIRSSDNQTLTFRAKRIGALLRFSYSATVRIDIAPGGLGDGNTVLALFRDNEVNAIRHCLLPEQDYVAGQNFHRLIQRSFLIAADDASDHTYKIAITRRTGTGGTTISGSTWTNRIFQVEEKG